MICKNCGCELKDNNKFCPKCGSAVSFDPVQEAEQQVQQPQVTEAVPPAPMNEESENVQPPKKKKSKKGIIILSVVLAVVLLLGGCATALYFIDPMGWFSSSEPEPAPKKEEEEFVLTEEMLAGYWEAEIDMHSAFEMYFDTLEIYDDFEIVGKMPDMNVYFYFDGSTVYQYTIGEEMLELTEELYDVMVESFATSKEMQEDFGMDEDELKEELRASLDYQDTADEILDMDRDGIFVYNSDENCSYEIDDDEITVSNGDESFLLEYNENGHLEIISYESDDDEDGLSLITEDMVFNHLTEKQVDKLESKYVEVDEEYVEGWLEEKQPVEEGFTFGKVYGNTYQNDYLGIGCTLDDKWEILNNEEVTSFNDWEFGDFSFFENIAESEIMAIDMYALNENQTDSVNILVTAMSLSEYGISVEEYLEMTEEQLKESSSVFYSDVTTTIYTITVDGKEMSALLMEGTAEGVKSYHTQIVLDCGDCFAVVTVATSNENYCEDIFGQFYFTE